MATVEIKISDLSGQQITDDAQAARLIVEHPDFPEPIGLDVSIAEVQAQLTDAETRFVVITVDDSGERFVLPVEEFNALFADGDSITVLERALETQQRGKRGRGRRSGSGTRRQGTKRRQRIDYASPEHAGEPHAGRVSPAEQEYVRDNLDAVNARLREKGLREILPDDLELAGRYGLTTEPIEDAEVIEETPPG